MEIFKSKTPYTVTSSKTPKMIGTILLVTSALIFNACCKDVTTPVKNYRVLDAYTSDNVVTFEFSDYYESSGGWSTTSDEEAVTINVSGILYTLFPTELNSVSTISGVYYTIYGTQIADLIYNKWLLDTNPLKPLMTKVGKTITIVASLSATIITGRIDNVTELVTPSNINWLNINTIANYYKDTSSFSTVNFIIAYPNQKNLKLIVNINGVDTVIPNEDIVDNVWTLMGSTDIITTYKITSEDGLTIYRTGDVETF